MENTKLQQKSREAGLDIIRVIATVLVLVTHATAYMGPLNSDPCSPKWTVALVARFTALACVPLFMLLTGYLNRKKKFSARYYLGILPVVISYLLIATASAVASDITQYIDYNAVTGTIAVLNFTANGYSWYVEMYVTLYCVIPFLNMLYEKLDTPKNKLIFTAIISAFTLLPAAIESFRVGGVTLDIIPDYFEAAYPIAYYFIGAIIGEYKPKIKKPIALAMMLAAPLIPSGLCWIFSYRDGAYAWYMMNGFSCVTTAAVAVTIFLFFYDIRLPKIPSLVVRELSVCSFEMYLFSYLFDLFMYSKFTWAMPVMVAAVFAMSYVAARCMRLVLSPLYRLIDRAKRIN